MPPARRIDRIAQATSTLIGFVATWDRIRIDPDVADFAFGNPQEPVLEAFPGILAAATKPQGNDYYAWLEGDEGAGWDR